MSLLSGWFSRKKEASREDQVQFWKDHGLCPGCGSKKFRIKIMEPGPEARAAGVETVYVSVCINCGTEFVRTESK